jgi:hypothetical protein
MKYMVPWSNCGIWFFILIFIIVVNHFLSFISQICFRKKNKSEKIGSKIVIKQKKMIKKRRYREIKYKRKKDKYKQEEFEIKR